MSELIFTFEDGSQSLAHHGIKGMKWGVRRFQNEDGSLTSAGKNRYLKVGSSDTSITRETKNDYNKMSNREFFKKYQTTKKSYAKRVAKSSTGDPFADTRKQMMSTEQGRKMFDASAKAEAKSRAIGQLNARTKKTLATRTRGQKVMDTLLYGSKSNQLAYHKLNASNASNGEKVVGYLLGGRVANSIANRHYLNSSAGKRASSRQYSRYYK